MLGFVAFPRSSDLILSFCAGEASLHEYSSVSIGVRPLHKSSVFHSSISGRCCVPKPTREKTHFEVLTAFETTQNTSVSNTRELVDLAVVIKSNDSFKLYKEGLLSTITERRVSQKRRFFFFFKLSRRFPFSSFCSLPVSLQSD